MQTLNINGETDQPTKRKTGFWRRQFQSESSRGQKIFDWIFGIVMPTICIAFDPIVFKGNFSGNALFGTYKPFAYLLTFVSIIAMAGWLLVGEKLKSAIAPVSGLFFVGSLVSLAMGIVLLPFSLIGLLVLIGMLGFTPLVTSFVYLRNAFRTLRAARPIFDRSVLVYSVALGAVFSAVVPFVANVEIERRLNAIKNGDVETIRTETQTLRYVWPLANFDSLISGYHGAMKNYRSTDRSEAIAEAYRELTGADIEDAIKTGLD